MRRPFWVQDVRLIPVCGEWSGYGSEAGEGEERTADGDAGHSQHDSKLMLEGRFK